MIDALHGGRRADPQQPALVAGDPEMATRAERLERGVPIPDDLMAQRRGVAWTGRACRSPSGPERVAALDPRRNCVALRARASRLDRALFPDAVLARLRHHEDRDQEHDGRQIGRAHV